MCSKKWLWSNPTSIRPIKRNRSSNNDSLQKHQSESTFTRWRHRILRHCCRSTTRRHACPILLYHLSRLCAQNYDRQNQRKSLRADEEKKQKVPRKNNYRRRLRRWHSQTKPRHYCIVWNKPPQALASMSMHTKLNTCVTTKLATLPH